MNKPQRYEHKLLQSVITARLVGQLPTGLHHVNVAHDDWCQLLANKGPCNCNPAIGPPVPHNNWKG